MTAPVPDTYTVDAVLPGSRQVALIMGRDHWDAIRRVIAAHNIGSKLAGATDQALWAEEEAIAIAARAPEN